VVGSNSNHLFLDHSITTPYIVSFLKDAADMEPTIPEEPDLAEAVGAAIH